MRESITSLYLVFIRRHLKYWPLSIFQDAQQCTGPSSAQGPSWLLVARALVLWGQTNEAGLVQPGAETALDRLNSNPLCLYLGHWENEARPFTVGVVGEQEYVDISWNKSLLVWLKRKIFFPLKAVKFKRLPREALQSLFMLWEFERPDGTKTWDTRSDCTADPALRRMLDRDLRSLPPWTNYTYKWNKVSL